MAATACDDDDLGEASARLTSGLQGNTMAKPAKLQRSRNCAGANTTVEEEPSKYPSITTEG